MAEVDDRALGVASKQHGDHTDRLDALGAATRAQRGDGVVARCTVADRDLDLDEFVLVERAVEFCEHAVTQAVPADGDDGTTMMRETTQEARLMRKKRHGGVLGGGAFPNVRMLA